MRHIHACNSCHPVVIHDNEYLAHIKGQHDLPKYPLDATTHHFLISRQNEGNFVTKKLKM